MNSSSVKTPWIDTAEPDIGADLKREVTYRFLLTLVVTFCGFLLFELGHMAFTGFQPILLVEMGLALGVGGLYLFRQRVPLAVIKTVCFGIVLAGFASGLFIYGLLAVAVVGGPFLVICALLVWGRRGALLMLSLVVAVEGLSGWLFVTGRLVFPGDLAVYFLAPGTWVMLAVATGLLSGMFIVQFAPVGLALTHSEAHYRHLFEMESDAIILIDVATQKNIDANPAAVRLYGYSREELLALKATDLSAEPEVTSARITAGGQIERVTLRYHRRKDGGVFPVEIMAHFFELQGQKVLLVAIRDITERQRVEQEIKHKASFPQLNPDPVLEVNAAGQLVYCNPAAQALFNRWGLAAESTGLWSPDLLAAVQAQPDSPVQREVPLGDQVWSEQVWWTAEFGTARIYAHDVTERRQAEQKLQQAYDQIQAQYEELQAQNEELVAIDAEVAEANRRLGESEAKARRIIEALPMGMHMYRLEADDRLVFVGANPAADRILGVANSQFVGQTLEAAFPPLVQTEVPVRYCRAAAQGEGWHTEQVEYADEQIQGAFDVYAFQTEPGHMATVFMDITQRRRMEQQLQQAYDQIQAQYEELQAQNEELAAINAEVAEANRRLGESEVRYRELVNAMPSAVAVYAAIEAGGDFIFKDFNRAGEQIENIERATLLGRRVTEIFPGMVEFGLLAVLQQVWRTGQPVHYPAKLYRDQRITGWRENYVYKLPSGEVVAVYEDVTDREWAEEALRRSTALLEAQFQNSPDWIVIIDRDYKIATINRAFSAAIDPAELRGADMLAMFPPAYQALCRQTIDRCLVTGEIQELEHGLFDDRWAQSRVIPLAGMPDAQRVMLIATDITERRRAEEVLRQREAKLQSIFRAAPVGIGMVVDRVIREVNECLCRMVGYTRAELLGQSARLLYPTDAEYEYVGREKYAQIRAQGTGTVETRWRRKDGQIIDIILSSTPLNVADWSEGVTFTALDITERKQAEEALREKTEELDRFFSLALDLLCIADTNGYFRRLNPEWEKVLGYPLAELAGCRFMDLVHPEDVAVTEQALAQLAAQQRVVGFVNRYRCRDGSYRWVEWRSIPYGDLIYAAARDITERIRAEETLRASEAHFRAIFENSTAGIALMALDISGRYYLAVNPAFARIFGYTIEESRAANFFVATHPDDIEPSRQAMQAIRDGRGQGVQYHQRYIHKDGHTVWAEVSSTLLLDATGAPEYFITHVTDITENKLATEALRASEQKFSLIFEKAPFAVVLSRLDEGTIEQVNAAFETMFGYSRQEIVGRTAVELGLYADRVTRQRAQAEVEAHGFDQNMVLQLRTKAGELRDFLVNTDFVEIDKKEHVLATAQDITERRRAEEALRASEARLREAQRLAHLGNWEWNLERQTLTWSDEIYHIFGLTPGVFPPSVETLEAAIHPADRADFLAQRERMLAEKRSVCIDHRIVLPDGAVRYVQERAQPVEDEAGALRGVVGTVQDITESKQAEEALHRYANRLKNLRDIDMAVLAARSAQDIAAVTLSQLRQVVPYERACVFILAEPPEPGRLLACAGTALPEALWPEWLTAYLRKMSAILRAGQMVLTPDLTAGPEPEPLLDALRTAGLLSLVNLPLVAEGNLIGTLNLFGGRPGCFEPEHLEIAQEVAISLAVAIRQAHLHEQLQAHAADLERRVIERTSQLQASNKELEAFAYSISHDLRAPLRVIDGYSLALLEDYGDRLDEEACQHFERIRLSCQRMGQLIDDLLEFSRLTRKDLAVREVDLSELARVVLEGLRQGEPRRQVELVIAAGVKATADESLLRVVLENLLGNAWKFTAKCERPRIEFGQQTRLDGEQVYYVRDNGAGFDMTYSSKLFGVFQRLHSLKEFPGTGVGLASVQRIIHRHGGRVWAEGAVGEGATFYFTLP